MIDIQGHGCSPSVKNKHTESNILLGMIDIQGHGCSPPVKTNIQRVLSCLA